MAEQEVIVSYTYDTGAGVSSVVIYLCAARSTARRRKRCSNYQLDEHNENNIDELVNTLAAISKELQANS